MTNLFMEEIYALPVLNNISIETHYHGRKIDKLFYQTNTELFRGFPTAQQVLQRRAEILNDIVKGVLYTIIVFEDGIYTVES